MKATIGLFYGSNTGNTEEIVHKILDTLGADLVDTHDVGDGISASDFDEYKYVILSCPTWYIGQLQEDWEDFLEEFETVNFTGKCVAMFGLGDQVGYADNFLDAVGIIAKIVINNGGTIVGKWPIDGYDFDESLALTDDGDYFYGLGIDEDNQDELTEERLETWLDLVSDAIVDFE